MGLHSGPVGTSAGRRRVALPRSAGLQHRQIDKPRRGRQYDRRIISEDAENTMGRTPGAKNKTPRELRAEAKRLTEKASYMEKLAKLRKKK